jgi:maltose alpha-D-glucosyltransferase/alpha-amylase
LPNFAHRVVDALAHSCEFENSDGTVRFRPTEAGRKLLPAGADPNVQVNWLTAEQSNSSLTIGDSVMLKLFRRIAEGEHPEAEMSRYLTEAGFTHAPPLLGDIVQVRSEGHSRTLAVALGFVRNQGDAWSWTLDHLTRALDNLAPTSSEFEMSDCEAISGAIGRRLGEMHVAFGRETSNEAFASGRADDKAAAGWAQKTEQRLEKAFTALEQIRDWANDSDRDRAMTLLNRRAQIWGAINTHARSGVGSPTTRIHGDFHLGQVLVVSGDVFIIDFEGEPATSIKERRAKTSPLRDVAGLIRSIDYAGAALVEGKGVGAAPVDEHQRNRLIAEFRARATRAFLREYWAARGVIAGPEERALLELFLIEKAAYEIHYEAANRPTWISVPLAGLLRLTERLLDKAHA